MARHRVPKLCRHKSSGLAYVTDPATKGEVYMGPYGSGEATSRYHAWLLEFLSRASPTVLPSSRASVDRMIDAYLTWADAYYLKRGKPTSERKNLDVVTRRVLEHYGELRAEDFGPTQLKAVRASWVKDDLSRDTINAYARKIVRIWKWACEHEMVSAECLGRLKAVQGLAKGRTSARETEDVPPVPLDVVEATLPFLSEMIRAIVRVQLACAMRPGEAVALRPCDLDRTGEPWRYRVHDDHNKTAHKGKTRTAWVGPVARAVLLPWLAKCSAPTDWVFRGRKGGHYTEGRYAAVIATAAEAAGTDHWFPNQLRHTQATAVRAKHGAEAAQAVLGHSDIKTTEIYAERDESLCRRIMEAMG